MTRLIIGLGLAMLISGCAMGGNATARGTGALAIGGTATTHVQINGSIALGDKVAEEAAKAAEAYLKASPAGAVAAVVKSTAVDNGVAAGVKKAREEGKEPTAKDLQELHSKLEEGVNHAVSGTKRE
ncbi:MAG: hypothetical protein MRJ68_18935 [Nitrospira sp.]|nr:hypothetical protein [Nitrospira sp.]